MTHCADSCCIALVFAVFVANMAIMAAMLSAFALVALAGDGEAGEEFVNRLGAAARTDNLFRRRCGHGFFEDLLTRLAVVLVARHSLVILSYPVLWYLYIQIWESRFVQRWNCCANGACCD